MKRPDPGNQVAEDLATGLFVRETNAVTYLSSDIFLLVEYSGVLMCRK